MFTRQGQNLKLIKAYDHSNIADLTQDWAGIKKSQGHFCENKESCPFAIKAEFDYDTGRYMYFRSRAITAGISNNNGDLFPLDELYKSFLTFIGKGVYYNHDSDSPWKAFGVVLDSAWSPRYVQAEHDPYVEILGAIDKDLANEKYPFLIRSVESGILNATSMGCIASSATCSLCENLAHNMHQLCDHMNPDKANPFYVKGKRINGSIAYETNYGITFTEESIVNVPADPTAHLMEIFSSQKASRQSFDVMSQFKKLQSHFADYNNHLGRKAEFILDKPTSTEVPKEACSSCKCKSKEQETIVVAAADEAPKKADFKKEIPVKTEEVKPVEKKEEKKEALIPASFDPLVQEAIEKIVKMHVTHIVEGATKKEMSDLLSRLEQKILPAIVKDVKEAVARIRGQFPESSVPKVAPTPEAAKEEAKKAASLAVELLEDFGEWPEEARQKLVQAVQKQESWIFKGDLPQ